MSFLKIIDPKKRDFLVEEFLKTRKNIQQSYINERVGDIDLQRDLTKLFKPVIESQKEVVQNIVQPVTSALKPFTESLQKAIEFPKYPSVKAYDDIADDQQTKILYFGDVASAYLRQFVSNQKTDKTFGIYDKDGTFFIGNKPIEIKDNNIIVNDKEYRGTAGLWELLVMNNPDNNVYTQEDYDNYADILIDTNAIKQKNDPNSGKPKSSRSDKWKTLVRPVWSRYTGKGLQTVVLSSDPKALIDRLDLLMASKNAGNTGVRNEVVGICDELLRMGSIDKNTYKEIMLKV
jgi:hypothetical protein